MGNNGQPPPPAGGTPFTEGGLRDEYRKRAPLSEGGQPRSGRELPVRNSYNTSLKLQARQLRTNATSQENHLWYDYLRTYKPRFTRQRIIGSFIVDFYCAEVKLVIEIDGSQHYEAVATEYDRERTEYMKSLGIMVLRFRNYEVDKSFEKVCETINVKVMERK